MTWRQVDRLPFVDAYGTRRSTAQFDTWNRFVQQANDYLAWHLTGSRSSSPCLSSIYSVFSVCLLLLVSRTKRAIFSAALLCASLLPLKPIDFRRVDADPFASPESLPVVTSRDLRPRQHSITRSRYYRSYRASSAIGERKLLPPKSEFSSVQFSCAELTEAWRAICILYAWLMRPSN